MYLGFPETQLIPVVTCKGQNLHSKDPPRHEISLSNQLFLFRVCLSVLEKKIVAEGESGILEIHVISYLVIISGATQIWTEGKSLESTLERVVLRCSA